MSVLTACRVLRRGLCSTSVTWWDPGVARCCRLVLLQEEIDGVAVSCIDAAMPMVIMRAGDFGVSGYDSGAIGGDAVLMERIEKIRLEAGRRMELRDVAEHGGSQGWDSGASAPRWCGLFVLPDAAPCSRCPCGDRCDLCGVLRVDPGDGSGRGCPATG